MDTDNNTYPASAMMNLSNIIDVGHSIVLNSGSKLKQSSNFDIIDSE